MSPLFAIAPEPSFTDIGIFVVIAILLGRFFFQYSRHKREEAEKVEPRHNPPVHEQIETRVRPVEEKIDKVEHKLHGRISGLRNEIDESLKQNAQEVKSAAKEMRETYINTVDRMGKMEGKQEQLNQRQTATERKIDNHIAKDKS